MRSHNPHEPHSRTRYNVPQLAAGDVLSAPKVDRKVRVLAIVDRYPPIVNAGGESMLAALLEPLAADGHECMVVTQTRDEYERRGVFVHPRSARDGLAEAADVIVGHLMWTREVVETAARHRKPLVYVVHNHRQLRHWSLGPENVTVLVVNSRELAKNVETPRRRGMPDSWSRGLETWDGPSVVVRPPVRAADYAIDDPPPSERPYVTLVNPQPAKGSDLFYALAAHPNRRQWLTVEGGYGDQRRPDHRTPGVDWQAQTPNMRDKVYLRTRVLLMPSDYESWGMTAVEAMCAGIPVVAHPTLGLQESLGDAALFADRDDPKAWLRALDDLDDPDIYATWSARSLARAAELDAQAERDLVRWTQAVTAAAATAGVPSGR